MSIHPYRQWPHSHRVLLRVAGGALLVFLLVLWLHIIPRLNALQDVTAKLKEDETRFARNAMPLDAELLKKHLDNCANLLNGDEKHYGLMDLTQETLALASTTFQADIATAYPGDDKTSAEKVFINNSNRIDFKDIYDRLRSQFEGNKVTMTYASLGLDEESQEPVYQMILKLWTIKRLLSLAIQNNLEVEMNQERKASSIRALKTIAYAIDSKEETPYLLEFPVALRLKGTMQAFLKFADQLQTPNTYLPMKRLAITSTPPGELPPETTVKITELHFHIVCSAFFQPPAETKNATR